MTPTLYFASSELDTTMREEVLQGTVYYVRPLKIVKPMVLNGLGDGPKPQLLSAAELHKCPVGAWNKVPFTIGHPYTTNADGSKTYCSIGAPSIFQQFRIGHIFNAAFTADGRLAGEAWLDVDACQMLGGNAAAAIEIFKSGAACDVSSAYNFTLEETTGSYGGETYNAMQRDIHPDHVALLLDTAGACSQKDGCGLGVNAQDESLVRRFVEMLRAATAWSPGTQNATFHDIRENVSSALRKRFGENEMYWLMAVEDDPRRAVFEWNGELWALPFSVSSAGLVELSDVEPAPVQRSTTFITTNTEDPTVEKITTLEQFYACQDVDETVKTTVRDALTFQQATKEAAEKKREERLVALTANEHVTLSLEDLRTLSDEGLDQVEKMATNAAAKAKPTETRQPVRSVNQGRRPETSELAGNQHNGEPKDVGGYVAPRSTMPQRAS